MGVRWSYPVYPLPQANGTPVSAAALTAGTPQLGGQAPVIPGGVIEAGMRLRLKAFGELTSTSATPTVVLGFYIGAVGGAIGSAAVICASATLAISASATAWPFQMEYEGEFRNLGGSAGSIHGQGKVESWFNVGLTGDGTTNPMPTTAAARTVSTLNTYQNNQIDVGVTLSVTTGSPSVTVTDVFFDLTG
jgi:hypothetical protein